MMENKPFYLFISFKDEVGFKFRQNATYRCSWSETRECASLSYRFTRDRLRDHNEISFGKHPDKTKRT